ncbi:unnamed protein product [Arctogadus glacialis]
MTAFLVEITKSSSSLLRVILANKGPLEPQGLKVKRVHLASEANEEIQDMTVTREHQGSLENQAQQEEREPR